MRVDCDAVLGRPRLAKLIWLIDVDPPFDTPCKPPAQVELLARFQRLRAVYESLVYSDGLR